MSKFKNIRFSIVIFSMLVFCLLAGCSAEPAATAEPTEPPCQHQWTEADCLNAGSCALCGEVQSEALGHDWIAADCENPERCSRCSETQGEALGHSYGKWLLGETDMYQICSGCQQTESTEIDYSLYLEQFIYGRWNLCSMVKSGRYLASYWLPQDEVDPEYCFYEDGRVSSIGFEEKEISPSWSFDRGEYDSANLCHRIYISFPNSNELSSAYFNCMGDDITYVIPLNDNGDMITLSNSIGDAVGKVLAGTWSAWSQGSIYNISFSEDRSFTADIDGEISGFWQPRQPADYSDGLSSDVHIMLNYTKDGKEHSAFAALSNFYEGMSQKQMLNYLSFDVYVKDTYTHFGLDTQEFLTEAMKSADSAHLGTWTSLDYIVSTPNYENGTYSSEEEKGLFTDYSITFAEDGSFSAKLNTEIEGKWSLREIRREDGGVCLMYNLTAPGLEDYSYFQRYEDGNGYVYVSYTDNVSANYSLKQMNEEEIAARNELVANAPNMVLGEWFCTDGQDFRAVFNEDGTFTISSDTAPEMYSYEGYWYLNTINEFQGDYTYLYDLETIMEVEASENSEGTEITDLTEASDPAEPETYREDYALRLSVKDNLYTLELESVFVSGTMTNAEGLTIRADAASSLVGRWGADSAWEYDANTGDSKEVAADFYLDISEDGSFTGYAGQNIAGYLEFYDIKDGSLRYLVYYSEGPETDAMFILNGEYLSAYIAPYSVPFTKLK